MTDEEDELLADLSEAAAVALQSWINKPPTTDILKQVRRARNVVLWLAEMLKNSKETPPFRLMMFQALEAAFVIGKYCVVTPPIKKFLACERAATARGEKSQTPKGLALPASGQGGSQETQHRPGSARRGWLPPTWNKQATSDELRR